MLSLSLWENRNVGGKIFKASALWADAFYKSICPYVRLYVCLFTFEVPFNGLFAPTSRSRMSNTFRDSESLGKSKGKKWSNIETFLLGSGLKSPHKKSLFFCWFCITKHVGNHASPWIKDLWSKGISLILAYETVWNQGYQVVSGEDKNHSSGLLLSDHDFFFRPNKP